MNSERCGSDDAESTSVMSYSKRNRLTHQNRNTGSTANPPETDQLIVGDSTKDATIDDSLLKKQQPDTSTPSKLSPNTDTTMNQATTSDTSNTQLKNMSKAAVLRHLFFSQISSNTNAAESTSNSASSKETN